MGRAMGQFFCRFCPSCCGLTCDEYCAVEVKRDAKPAIGCCERCTQNLPKLHWWLLACILNTFLSPAVLVYHAVRIYVLPCLFVYITSLLWLLSWDHLLGLLLPASGPR